MMSNLTLEPPSWWCQHPFSPLRLLLRGRDLQKAPLRLPAGWKGRKPWVNRRGTALFLELTIPLEATPGDYTLQVGEQCAVFTLLPPLQHVPQGLGPEDVIYLLLPDRFCDGDPRNNEPLYDPTRPRHYHGGDFSGLRQKLPYLKELGVTALWLTPLYTNATQPTPGLFYDGEPAIDYHGYGAVDLYGVEPHFGSLEELQALTAAAHACGLKVIQDQVPNHVGPQHPWATDPPMPHWLTPQRPCSFQGWQLLDPYATPAQQAAMTDGWFANLLPDLNVTHPEVERYLLQNSIWWVGIAGFDALRLDTVPYVAKSFWREWRSRLHSLFPSLFVIGEVLEFEPHLVASYQDTLESLFDFPLCGALRRVFTQGASLLEIPKTLAQDRLYADPTALVTFLGLHDLPRFSGDTTALKLAATVVFTVRGIPLLYYGDELALPGGEDPDNRRHFPGGFPQDTRDAFTALGRTPQEEEVWRHFQQLCHLRQRSAALQRGQTRHLLCTEAVFAYARFTEEGELVLVVLNASPHHQRTTIPLADTPLVARETLTCALTGATMPVTRRGLSVALPPRTVWVLEKSNKPSVTV